MIRSGAKVTSDKTDEGEVITIFPDSKPWQRTALGVWLVIWVMTGVLAFVGGLGSLPKDEYTFLIVFIGFWFYFLFYAARSLVWLRTGAEYLRITKDSLDYKRSWGGYGSVKSYDLSTIKKLGLVDYSSKTFAKTYNEVFWTIGGESIGFEYIGKKIAFGFKLEAKDAEKIIRTLNKAINQARD